ncbi:MAG: hypothetical protein GY940_17340, partial [bacterium]|nr:hypothetical protein [bacterium]
MKRYVLITGLILGLIISLSPGAFPQDAKADAKLAKAEAKLEKVLGTNSNWKATVFKDLRYGMPCKEVKKYFKGLKCSSF